MAPKLALSFRVQEPRPERTQTVERSVVRIGSGEGADLRVDDPLVGDLHVAIEASSPTDVTLLTLKTPTLVNGTAVDRCELSRGDRILIGSTTIVFDGTEQSFDGGGSYREPPPLTQEEQAITPVAADTSPLVVPRFDPLRWWSLPVAATVTVAYLAVHGLTVPAWADWSFEAIALDWPIPRPLFFLPTCASLLALGDAIFRGPDGARAPLARLSLALAALVAAPLLLQLAFVAMTVGGVAIGAVTVAAVVIGGIYMLVKWIARGETD